MKRLVRVLYLFEPFCSSSPGFRTMQRSQGPGNDRIYGFQAGVALTCIGEGFLWLCGSWWLVSRAVGVVYVVVNCTLPSAPSVLLTIGWFISARVSRAV